jgi:hypothetical protein
VSQWAADQGCSAVAVAAAVPQVIAAVVLLQHA